MKQDIRKHYENASKGAETHQHAFETLGDWSKVTSFANFYRNHKDDINIIVAGAMVDKLLKEDVDSNEAKAFKDGLLRFASFFRMCKIEVENKNAKSKEEGETVITVK